MSTNATNNEDGSKRFSLEIEINMIVAIWQAAIEIVCDRKRIY
jgi:hypothetical protein